MRILTVAAAISDNKWINKPELFLVCRRSLDKKFGGYWELPGGKVEEGETLKEALRRELQEELGIGVDILDYLTEGITEDVHLVVFRTLITSIPFPYGTSLPKMPVHIETKILPWKQVKELHPLTPATKNALERMGK